MITIYERRPNLSLDAMALEMPLLASPHVNRLPFKGCLTRLGEPSTRPPHGAQGHRVLLPHDVAERALPTLIGMAVNIAATNTDHAPQYKIGVITGAEIVGNDLLVSGHLYGKDFPKEVAYIQANKDVLGMSFEVSNVMIDDPSATIWTLRDCQFTGGAILRKDSAAYAQTAIAARAAKALTQKEYAMAKSTLERLSALQTQIEAMAEEFHAAEEADDEDAEAEEVDAAEEADDEEAGGDPKTMKKKLKANEDTSDVLAAIERLEGMVTTLAAAKGKDKPRPVTRKPKGKKSVAEQLQGLLEAGSDDDETTLETLVEAYRRQKMQASTKAQEKRLQSIEAAMELLTDSVTSLKGLLTDVQSTVGKLATDKAATDNNGGKADPPQRKTMSAQQGAKFVQKGEEGDGTTPALQGSQIEKILQQVGVMDVQQRQSFLHEMAAGSDNPAHVDLALHKAGITDTTQRIAIKYELKTLAQAH